MFFEQLLMDNFEYYHQNSGDWFHWCQANKSGNNAEFLRRLKTGESTQVFFGDWNNYQGYSDVGYYIGCEFVKLLIERYSLDELAKLSEQTVYETFCEHAGKT